MKTRIAAARFAMMCAIKRAIKCAILALALAGILGTGGPAFAGDEFVVNTTIVPGFYPGQPNAVALAGGEVVMIWGQMNPNVGGSGTIYGQLISATGTKVGSEFHVASLSARSGAAIGAALPDGGFIAVWWDRIGTQESIAGQRFSATGAKVGSVFALVPPTTDFSFDGIAALANGELLMMWYRERRDLPDVFFNFAAQRYSANGSQVGGPFSLTDRNVIVADVISLGTSWLVTRSSGNGVYARRLAPDGQRIGAEFKVNTTDNSSSSPRAALLSNGLVIAAWSDDFDTYLQRFTVAGKKRGAEWRPTQRGVRNQWPNVAALNDGGFVVVWQRRKGYGRDCSARRYLESGHAAGKEMLVKSTCYSVGVVPLSAGGYLAFWAGSTVIARAFDP